MPNPTSGTNPERVQAALDRAIEQLSASRDRLRAGGTGEAEVLSLEQVRGELGGVLPELAALAGPESQIGLRARVIVDRLEPELQDHLSTLVAHCTASRGINDIFCGDLSLRLKGVHQALCPADDNAHICRLLVACGILEHVNKPWAFYPSFRITPLGFAVAGILRDTGQQSGVADSRPS